MYLRDFYLFEKFVIFLIMEVVKFQFLNVMLKMPLELEWTKQPASTASEEAIISNFTHKHMVWRCSYQGLPLLEGRPGAYITPGGPTEEEIEEGKSITFRITASYLMKLWTHRIIEKLTTITVEEAQRSNLWRWIEDMTSNQHDEYKLEADEALFFKALNDGKLTIMKTVSTEKGAIGMVKGETIIVPDWTEASNEFLEKLKYGNNYKTAHYNRLNCYKALKLFMNTPETKKMMMVQKSTGRFGL